MNKSLCSLGEMSPKYIENEKRLQIRIDDFLDALASDLGHPVNKWNCDSWMKASRGFLRALFLEMDKHENTFASGEELYEEFKRRKRDDKRRVQNRADQVGKRAFQKAVTMNIEGYPTKASAIRDLKIKPQFEGYPDSTLRRWLTDIWIKPTKPGRPKKAKE